MQLVIQKLLSEMETMEEMAAIFKRFGDEQSTLLDQYERLSFEVQLNQAMLGRSLSEPAEARCHAPPKVLAKSGKQGRRSRGLGFRNAVKKLFSPILGKKGGRKDDATVSASTSASVSVSAAAAPDPKNPILWKTFSKSLRV